MGMRGCAVGNHWRCIGPDQGQRPQHTTGEYTHPSSHVDGIGIWVVPGPGCSPRPDRERYDNPYDGSQQGRENEQGKTLINMAIFSKTDLQKQQRLLL